MTKKPKLMASYFTLAGNVMPLAGSTISPVPLHERVQAAAAAGFTGIGLIGDDTEVLVEKHGVAGIKSIIADSGLTHIEFEVLLDWFTDGERRANSDRERKRFFDLSEKLGAFHLKVGGDISGEGDWSIQRMTDSFRQLCREAAGVGLMVTIEIFPASNIRDLETAVAIAGDADEPNGGLLLDIWHMTRGNIPYSDIPKKVPAHLIKHIELDDATANLVGTIMEDTLLRRKFPGEGEFDIPDYLRVIGSTDFDGFYGVEVLSEEQRRIPVAEAARRAADGARRQFALAFPELAAE